jgi:hypothetical protein
MKIMILLQEREKVREIYENYDLDVGTRKNEDDFTEGKMGNINYLREENHCRGGLQQNKG